MEPLGLSAFVFVLVGFLAGRYADTADRSAGYAPLVSAFAATLLANVLLAMAQYLLERQAPLGFFLGRVLVPSLIPVSYPHLRAHETRHDLVCRLLLEKKKKNRS